MPSPLGHALAGVAVGCLVTGRGQSASMSPLSPTRRLRQLATRPLGQRVLAFGLLGMLPDVDFLTGFHSAYTHSLGAMLVVGVVTAILGFRLHPNMGIAAAAAYGSHVLLDWLGTDDVAPYGVMALWPVDGAFFLSELHWFPGVCRGYWLGSCWLNNAGAVLWELSVLGPIAAARST